MNLYKEQMLSEIIKIINTGNSMAFAESLDRFVYGLKKYKVSKWQYQMIFVELLSEIFQLMQIHHLDGAAIFGDDFDLFEELGNLSSLDEIEKWMKKQCFKVIPLIQKGSRNSASILKEKAKKYIEDNYADHTLSVEKLCNHLNISATHFSIIFKKEFGMSFIAYLTKVRMEHAIELLKHTEDKSYIIAEKVGYTEANYFSYAFKKYYGVSPKNYRIHQGK